MTWTETDAVGAMLYLAMRFLVIAGFLVLPIAGICETDVQHWLDRAGQAIDTLNYEGTVVFTHGDDVDTFEVLHGHEAGLTRERVVSLNGEAREISRSGDLVSCALSGTRFVLVDPGRKRHGLPSTISSNLDELESYYVFSMAGTGRVADRSCRLIRILPRDDFRFGYEICADERTGMPLKSVMVDRQGIVVEQSILTSLVIHDEPIPGDRFRTNVISDGQDAFATSSSHRGVDVLETGEPDEGWTIARIPPGFRVTENVRYPLTADSDPVQHMVLSDGMATVSVFIADPGSESAAFEGLTESGAMHVFARVLDGRQITVVGQVPNETVSQIGESVRYRGATDE